MLPYCTMSMRRLFLPEPIGGLPPRLQAYLLQERFLLLNRHIAHAGKEQYFRSLTGFRNSAIGHGRLLEGNEFPHRYDLP